MASKDGEDDRSGIARWHGRLTWKVGEAGGCRASERLLEEGSRDWLTEEVRVGLMIGWDSDNGGSRYSDDEGQVGVGRTAKTMFIMVRVRVRAIPRESKSEEVKGGGRRGGGGLERRRGMRVKDGARAG